ncbi:MAG: RelA/SpoT family protein [Candidatus Sumerlaeaceae bacterium]
MSEPALSETTDILEYILGDQKGRYSADDRALLTRAYKFAESAHEGQLRASGEPYITHCVETARILSTLLRDPTTLAAGLLHDTVEDCGVTLDQLAHEFSPVIAALVEGVTKISSLKLKGSREEKVETLRRLMLAMAKDLRVIIIKFADRIHNLRTLSWLPEEKQKRIAEESLELFAPLAGRLGMSRVKAELEDLAMQYLYPEAYEALVRELARHRGQHEAVIEKVSNILRATLEKHDVRADIQGRTKHLYSIWKKMQRQGIGLNSVYDIMAVRVICAGTPDDCYKVLGLIHSRWPPIPGRFRDFIAAPKENGYQSLHTTVLGPHNQRVEIQIRTQEMHRIAEEGVASHWKYKEGVRGDHDLEDKLVWLRRLVDWIQDVRDPTDFVEALKVDLSNDTVFCFTPKGDVVELPAGATALDFAYYIHSSVGTHCVGAVVNDAMVPLRYELKTGDVVEIKTSSKAHPTPDWLGIAKTSRARTKIKHWIRQQRLSPENVQKGKEALSRALRTRNLPVDWEEIEKRLAPSLKHYQVQSFEEFCGEVGFGGIEPAAAISRAYPELSRTAAPQVKASSSTKKKQTGGIIVADLREAYLRIAQCCAPVPGDRIIGFVTVGRGVTIHCEECPHIRRMREDAQLSQRLLPAEWDLAKCSSFEVGLRVECADRAGLLADVTAAITAEKVFILGSNTKSQPAKNTAILNFRVRVSSSAQLSYLFAAIKSVKGVLRVTRVGMLHNSA